MGDSNDTVLVTGAAGFIGSSLVDRLLSRGAHVVGVDNFCDFYPERIKRANLEQAMADERFTLIEADIRDRGAVMEVFAKHQPTTVVHLAAMAGVRPSIERPDYYTAVNIAGTVNLLDAAAGAGCGRFVFASSSSVYGNNQKVPFAEADPVDHPISPYAATKKSGELICHTYHHLHGMTMRCLRFFTVFGPRQRPDLAISKFLGLVSQGKTIPMFGDGTTSRDYTFIEDIVDGIEAVLDRMDADGGYRIYNLGGCEPVSLKQMIATIEQVVGKDAKIERLPMQAGDVDRTWADLTLVKKELGYEPRVSLREGIERQWAWMRKRAIEP